MASTVASEGARFLFGMGGTLAWTAGSHAVATGATLFAKVFWDDEFKPQNNAGLTAEQSATLNADYRALKFALRTGSHESPPRESPVSAQTLNSDASLELTVLKAAVIFVAALYGKRVIQAIFPKVLPNLPAIPKIQLPSVLPKMSFPSSLPRLGCVGEKCLLGALGLTLASYFG